MDQVYKSIKTFVLALLLTFTFLSPASTYMQQLWLYNGQNFTQSFFVFEKHMPYIPAELGPFKSFCYRGYWHVYNDTQFKRYIKSYAAGPSLKCVDGPFEFKSFRFGGALETETKNTISVYSEPYYQGQEVLVENLGSSKLNGKSIVFSGSTNWTLFEGEMFELEKFCCVFTTGSYTDFQVDGLPELILTLNISKIGSVLGNHNECTRAGKYCSYSFNHF